MPFVSRDIKGGTCTDLPVLRLTEAYYRTAGQCHSELAGQKPLPQTGAPMCINCLAETETNTCVLHGSLNTRIGFAVSRTGTIGP